jgi:hypothetical protein
MRHISQRLPDLLCDRRSGPLGGKAFEGEWLIRRRAREDGSVAHGGTDGSQTRRWREPDSNLYGAFPVK